MVREGKSLNGYLRSGGGLLELMARSIAISEISKPMCKMASGGAKFSPTPEVEEELDLFI